MPSIASRSAGGVSGRILVTDVGCEPSRFISTAVGVGPVNGGCPESISYAITPRA